MAGYGHALYGAMQGSLAGFGSGIVVNTVFSVASGQVTPTTTPTMLISGALVLALTAIGFGIGLMGGHLRDKVDDAAATPAP